MNTTVRPRRPFSKAASLSLTGCYGYGWSVPLGLTLPGRYPLGVLAKVGAALALRLGAEGAIGVREAIVDASFAA